MSPPIYPDFMRPQRLTPAELMRIPLRQGHHVVLADLNHPTGDTIAIVADAMRAIKESGAQIFLESPVENNRGVRATLANMHDPKRQREFLAAIARGTLQDIEMGNVLFQAGRLGVPVLNHDHGYQQIHSDLLASIPKRLHSLKINGLPITHYLLNAFAKGENVERELARHGFKPDDIARLSSAFETALETRANNIVQGDEINARFVVANGGNGLTVSVIGNGHTAFTPSLQRELTELGKKHTNVTQISIFDSRDGFPPILRDPTTQQLKPEYANLIGEHVYDVGTGTLIHIPQGSEARKHFLENIVPTLPAKTVEEANRTHTPPPDRNPKDYEPDPLPTPRRRTENAPGAPTGSDFAALPLPEVRPLLRVTHAGANGDVTEIDPAAARAARTQPEARTVT